MTQVLNIIMVLCLNSGENYHACHQETVECAKEISEHNDIPLFDAVLWCDAFGKEIDRKLFEQKEVNDVAGVTK